MIRKYTKSRIKEIVEEQTDGEYSLLSLEERGQFNPKTKKADKRKMTIQHNPCGHSYTLDIYEFGKGKRRCGKCKGEVLRKHFIESIDEIKLQLSELTKDAYSFVDSNYKGSKHKHKFLHHACNTVFIKSWEKFKTGQHCTHCQRKGMESMASRYVRDILDYFKIEYIVEQRFDDCRNPKTDKVLPFDYYLPTINLLVEVDGEQHDRASFTPGRFKHCVERDSIKNNYAKQKGIELIRLPAKEWKDIPSFLYDILSKYFMRELTLKEVQSVPQLTHPERINKDLETVHSGAYILFDNFFVGVDRKHQFKHLHCGKTFTKTVQSLKTEKFPCPYCRKGYIQLSKHDRSNTLLQEKSKNRYELDDSYIGVTKNKKRLIRCNQCKKSWFSLVGNIIQGKGGCPNCHTIKAITIWRKKYYAISNKFLLGEEFDQKETQWLYWNESQYKKQKIAKYKVRLLLRAGLI